MCLCHDANPEHTLFTLQVHRCLHSSLHSSARHRHTESKRISASSGMLQVLSARVTRPDSATGDNVELELGDGSRVSLAAVQLRDGCRCPECFHPTTLQRRVLLTSLTRSNTTPVAAQLVNVGPAPLAAGTRASGVGVSGSLVVEWECGHTSTYTHEWLLSRIKGRESTALNMVAWDAAWLDANLDHISFGFGEVLDGASTGRTVAWIDALRRYGLTLLRGARTTTGQLEHLSQTLALPLRRTVYDEERPTFITATKPNAVNQAYTAEALPLHTDLPFYLRPPAVQMLHCVKQVRRCTCVCNLRPSPQGATRPI